MSTGGMSGGRVARRDEESSFRDVSNLFHYRATGLSRSHQRERQRIAILERSMARERQQSEAEERDRVEMKRKSDEWDDGASDEMFYVDRWVPYLELFFVSITRFFFRPTLTPTLSLRLHLHHRPHPYSHIFPLVRSLANENVTQNRARWPQLRVRRLQHEQAIDAQSTRRQCVQTHPCTKRSRLLGRGRWRRRAYEKEEGAPDD
jgi:hypothetical protein